MLFRSVGGGAGGQWPAGLGELLERFRNPKAMGDDATIIRDVNAMRAAVEAAARATPGSVF